MDIISSYTKWYYLYKMAINVLLITPPFTQLNTPYPATAYLKGFLDSKNIDTKQFDLSIELFNAVFTKSFITKVFQEAEDQQSSNCKAVWDQREDYINKVEKVIAYLRNHQVTGAYQMLHKGFLPIAHRSENIDDELDWAFGNLGVLDKAKHFATLFIEELGDFIQTNVDEFFSFTRYAEKIASSASSFNEIDKFLSYSPTIIEEKLLEILNTKLKENPYPCIIILFSILPVMWSIYRRSHATNPFVKIVTLIRGNQLLIAGSPALPLI